MKKLASGAIKYFDLMLKGVVVGDVLTATLCPKEKPTTTEKFTVISYLHKRPDGGTVQGYDMPDDNATWRVYDPNEVIKLAAVYNGRKTRQVIMLTVVREGKSVSIDIGESFFVRSPVDRAPIGLARSSFSVSPRARRTCTL